MLAFQKMLKCSAEEAHDEALGLRARPADVLPSAASVKRTGEQDDHCERSHHHHPCLPSTQHTDGHERRNVESRSANDDDDVCGLVGVCHNNGSYVCVQLNPI